MRKPKTRGYRRLKTDRDTLIAVVDALETLAKSSASFNKNLGHIINTLRQHIGRR